MSDSEGSYEEDASVNSEEFHRDLLALTTGGRDPSGPAIQPVAIQQKLEEFAMPHLDFVEMQVVVGTSDHDPALVDDDLTREFAFYERALASVEVAEDHFKAAGVPYIRPEDYLAEMMKSDKQMLKVKAQLLKSKKNIEASERAKRQRELKKLGKQVQVERVKEKSQKKSAQLSAVKKWRDNRKQGSADDFDLSLLDAATSLDGKGKRPVPTPGKRRQIKNAKFGLGGKKRGMKRNTADSAASIKSFSQKRNNALFNSSATGGKKGAAGGAGGGRKRKAQPAGNKRPGKKARQSKR